MMKIRRGNGAFARRSEEKKKMKWSICIWGI
jgi:hypothetical protein